jgi:hypothetical protein
MVMMHGTRPDPEAYTLTPCLSREKVVVARMARDGELRRLFQKQSENILKTSFCVVEHTKIILKQKGEVSLKFSYKLNCLI